MARNTPIALPDGWKVAFRAGEGYFLQQRSPRGDWQTVAGPFRQRIGAVFKWHRMQYVSPYAPAMTPEGELMSQARDYPYIRAWGRFMGSDADSIEDQTARAREDHATPDALYCRSGEDGKRAWSRFVDIKSAETRYAIARIVADRAKGAR